MVRAIKSSKKANMSASKRILDAIFSVAAALGLSAVGVGLFFLAGHFHVSSVWVLAFFLAIIFAYAGGRATRSKFQRPLFILFFGGWLVLQVALSMWAALRGGFFWAVGTTLVGFFIYLFLTALLFGPINAKPSR